MTDYQKQQLPAPTKNLEFKTLEDARRYAIGLSYEIGFEFSIVRSNYKKGYSTST
jgi:hypothetical protein